MKMMNLNIHLDIFPATLLLIDVLHPLVGTSEVRLIHLTVGGKLDWLGSGMTS